MPSNQEYKGKGMKGRNYDELSGVGTSSAGKTGTTGNLNAAGHDGGVGTPDLADEGNLQRAGGQPGGTPAQGDSQRGYAGNQQSGQQGSQQSGNLGSQQSGNLGSQQSGNLGGQQSGQADQLRGGKGDRERGAKQLNQDDVGTAGPSER